MNSAKLLFFVEDPGAANFIADLPSLMDLKGINFRVIAVSFAAEYFKLKKINFEEIDLINTDAISIIENYDPKLIIVGTSQNPQSLGLELIDSGKKNGITTIGFVDTAADSIMRFKGKTRNPLNYSPDWLMVPDDDTKTAFINLGYDKDKFIICGNPNYEKIINIKKNLQSLGVNKIRNKYYKNYKDKKIIIFIDESSNEGDLRLFKSSEYTFSGRKNAYNRNEVIAGEVLDALNQLEINYHFVVRLHPKSNTEDYNSLLNEIDEFCHGNDPFEQIYSADLIVGMTSMLLMESFLLGKQVISAIPREYEKDWAPPGLFHSISCVTTSDMLKTAINQALKKSNTFIKETKYKELSSRKIIMDFLSSLLKDK